MAAEDVTVIKRTKDYEVWKVGSPISIQKGTDLRTGARRGAGPPPDPYFFKVLRLLRNQEGIDDPYSQHIWTYAAIQAVAKPISGVPFIFYKSSKASAYVVGEGGDPAYEKRVAERLEAMVAAIKGAGQPVEIRKLESVACIPDPQARFMSLRKIAPWLTPREMTRTVGDLQVVYDGPWPDLFQRVNPTTTYTQLWEETVINLRADGRCFWVLRGKMGPLGADEVPHEIWVRPDKGWKASKINKGTGEVLEWEYTYHLGDDGWRMGISGTGERKTLKYKPEELVIFRYVDRNNPFGGLSPTQASESELRMDWHAQRYNINFFREGAVIGGVLISDEPLTGPQEKALLDEWNLEHRGSDRAHSTAILSGGLKWVPNTATQRDMEFKSIREFARDSILACHRVSPSVLGLTGNVGRSNQDAILKAHWETNLIPEMMYLEAVVNTNLISKEGVGDSGVWGAFDLSQVEALREDLWRKLRSAKILFDMGYPINDINARLSMGMADMPWGSTGYLPKNILPVVTGEAGGGAGDAGGDAAEGGGDGEGDDGGDDGSTPAPVAPPPNKNVSDGDGGEGGDNEAESAAWERVKRELVDPSLVAYQKVYRRLLSSQLRSAQLRACQASNSLSPMFDLVSEKERAWETMREVYESIYTRAAGWSLVRLEDLWGSKPQFSNEAQTRVYRIVELVHREVTRAFSMLHQPSTLDDHILLSKTVFNRLATSSRINGVTKLEVGWVLGPTLGDHILTRPVPRDRK